MYPGSMVNLQFHVLLVTCPTKSEICILLKSEKAVTNYLFESCCVFIRFGVISVPEVTDWQPLTPNDSYLVAASDGVLEKLSSQDVCDLFWQLHTDAPLELINSSSCSYSLADCIVDTALERGSMDNVAAVVVPFGVEALPSERSSDVRLQNYIDEQSGNFY